MKNAYTLWCLLLLLFITSSLSAQDCKGLHKKTDKATGITSFIALPKGRVLKASDPNELDVIIARKFVSSADTLYDVLIYKAISEKPDKESRKGVSLLFEDGSLIERPNQDIELTKMATSLALKAQVQLKAEEVAQLGQKTLKKVKLITNEHPVYLKMAESFKQKAECLLQAI